ncbi:MAG: hypothetical protein HY744_00720 [Deltaproteobacteria bacterium]|nr:hypothetical protein [Deltaproteobacteria bacterium]
MTRPGARYPLSVLDERTLSPGYDGPVYVWDIDRTYLATRFSSLRHLARIPLEFAIDKRAIPGMPEVLRALRRGTGPGFGACPIYFVSASPPQLRPVVARKMLLDGVEYDGITFKDWRAVLRGLRPGRLREQVGFKLCALLTGRASRPLAREWLFGDDVEQDALAYSLYAQLLSAELGGPDAEAALAAAGVAADDRACILALRSRLAPRTGAVQRAFIFLDRGTPPAHFDCFAPLVVPVRDALQLALALQQLGLVDERAAAQVTLALKADRRSAALRLDRSVEDAVARGLVSAELARDAGRG